jgi:hypothetical protein
MLAGKRLCHEKSGRDDKISRIEVAAADVVPRHPVAVRDSIRRRCEACLQGVGTFGAYTVIVYSALTGSAQRKSAEVSIEKCCSRQNLVFDLIANKKANLHIAFKMNCFHFVETESHDSKRDIT